MPQKKTRKNKNKTKHNQNHNQNHKHFYRTPTPYPFSPMQNISGIVSSSSATMKAVSRDGKHWHVDTDINGAKKHANLTNSQIMDILAYPAAKQDLKTQLIQKLRDISPRPMCDEHREYPNIEYIYKNGCPNKPIMLNKLSPLHEAIIIPESDGEPIYLFPNPMHLHNDNESGLSSIRIRKAKKKSKSKGMSKGMSKGKSKKAKY